MFSHCKTMEALNAEFRQKAKIHHPDKGGNAEMFQQVKEAMERRKQELNNPPPTNGASQILSGIFGEFISGLSNPQSVEKIENITDQLIDGISNRIKADLKNQIRKKMQTK